MEEQVWWVTEMSKVGEILLEGIKGSCEFISFEKYYLEVTFIITISSSVSRRRYPRSSNY
jgi:hypothetical protein